VLQQILIRFLVAAIVLGAADRLLAQEAPTVVTRAEAMKMAERYLRHVWKPTEHNIFHGLDAEGVQVDTPDAGFKPAHTRHGWWVVGRKNVGLPYMWGGFDTPESFEAGLRARMAAGDIYSAEKRRLLDAGVSKQAVGIDCSGLISRCWKLPRSFSTRELAGLCNPIDDMKHLKPGDVFNRHNDHVLMFGGWIDKEHTRICAYEAGSPPTWKVLLNAMPLKFLTDQGYTAWRYRGMRD